MLVFGRPHRAETEEKTADEEGDESETDSENSEDSDEDSDEDAMPLEYEYFDDNTNK